MLFWFLFVYIFPNYKQLDNCIIAVQMAGTARFADPRQNQPARDAELPAVLLDIQPFSRFSYVWCKQVVEKQIKIQKQVVVVGGGVVGICTAYFLAAAGHQVAVIERRTSVAEGASFGHPGIIAPGCVAPWASPDLPTRILSSPFAAETSTIFRPHASRALWHWLRQWRPECDPQRILINRERMQRLAFYSQGILHEIVEQHRLEYENTNGVLQLFRTEKDIVRNAPLRTLLAENDVLHELVDAATARQIEPALAPETPLAGALYLPDGEAGNCALLTKQLRQVAQALGVQFHFPATVDAIQAGADGIALRIGGETVSADAVVLAAGADSAQLLHPLGIAVPLHPVSGYSITLPLRNFDAAPTAALIDASSQVAITRMGNRIRIAGISDLGAQQPGTAERALRILTKAGTDWFPGAASYPAATLWRGARPMLADGAPLLGATRIKNLYLNIGHGDSGWAMAAGSGKILADVISQRAPDIDLDGLTLARYG